MICPLCTDVIVANECDCGWKAQSSSTIQIKDQNYRKPIIEPPLHEEVRSVAAKAPLLKYGATKVEVGNYWMTHIRQALGKFK